MIVGVGTDLVDIRRVERAIARFGARFIDRVFTDAEQGYCDRRKGAVGTNSARASAYAKRFAAKEACAKALGTGLARGVGWRDIGVVNQTAGMPTLVLGGAAAKRLSVLTPAGLAPALHLSMTDEYPLAQAFVVISAEASATPVSPSMVLPG